MSEVLEYLNQKGISYNLSGSEAVIICPICGKNKMSININTSLFQCFYCQARNPNSDLAKGSLGRLKEYYGDILTISKPSPLEFSTKEIKEVNFSIQVDRYHEAILSHKKALKYLTITRGINIESIKRFKLGVLEMKGQEWISIPAFKGNTPIFIKYRKLPPDVTPDLEKCEREFGGESILFNQDCIDKYDELFITEGELDSIMLIQQGYENTVGTTVGAGTLKPEWYDLLVMKSRLNLIFDNDEAGQKAAREVWSTRLGIGKCWSVRFPNRGDGKKEDVNSFFLEHTKEEFEQLLKSAEQFKVKGVLSFSETLLEMYRRANSKYEEVFELPWPSVNKLLNGGLCRSRLTVLGGTPGTGKTSLALQICYHFAIKYNMPSFFFCLEMPEVSLATKIVQLHFDLVDQEVKYENAMEYFTSIRDLPIYFGYSSKITPDVFYNTMKEVRDRYGVQFGVFDNLQRMVRSGEEADMARASGNFKDITMDLNIPFILVSQPRKTDGKSIITFEDLKGTSAISADGDEIILMYRKRVKTLGTDSTNNALEPETRITVDKSRFSSGGSVYLEMIGNKSKFIEKVR